MLLPLRLTIGVYATVAGWFFLAAGFTSAFATTMNGDRTRGNIHGLHEIRDAAVKFIAVENVKNGTRWLVLEPNAKILVAKCAVALRVKWVPKSHGLSEPNVAVICSETVKPAMQNKWEVFVPIYQGAKAHK